MTSEPTPVQRATEAAKRSVARAKRVSAKILRKPQGRAAQRYLENNGNVLAGGIAYYSLASVAAAVVLAVSVASFVVWGNPTYRDAVFEFIGNAIPGIFPSNGSEGLVNPDTIQPTTSTGVVGLITFGVLVYTATRYMRGLRAGVRTMLGSAGAESIPGMLRDLIALVGLALIALIATGLQIVASSFAEAIAGIIGDQGVQTWAVSLVAAGTGFLANAGFAALVFLVVGRAHVRARVMVPTIAATAFVISVLQQASGYFVQSASGNPVLAPFAAIIALLLFVDITARVLLIASAWLGAAYSVSGRGGPVMAVEPPGRRRVGITTARGTRRDRSRRTV